MVLKGVAEIASFVALFDEHLVLANGTANGSNFGSVPFSYLTDHSAMLPAPCYSLSEC